MENRENEDNYEPPDVNELSESELAEDAELVGHNSCQPGSGSYNVCLPGSD